MDLYPRIGSPVWCGNGRKKFDSRFFFFCARRFRFFALVFLCVLRALKQTQIPITFNIFVSTGNLCIVSTHPYRKYVLIFLKYTLYLLLHIQLGMDYWTGDSLGSKPFVHLLMYFSYSRKWKLDHTSLLNGGGVGAGYLSRSGFFCVLCLETPGYWTNQVKLL
jgi:hypothetical protein